MRGARSTSFPATRSMLPYDGVITLSRWPARASSRGTAPSSAPAPPPLEKGAASAATWTMSRAPPASLATLLEDAVAAGRCREHLVEGQRWIHRERSRIDRAFRHRQGQDGLVADPGRGVGQLALV